MARGPPRRHGIRVVGGPCATRAGLRGSAGRGGRACDFNRGARRSGPRRCCRKCGCGCSRPCAASVPRIRCGPSGVRINPISRVLRLPRIAAPSTSSSPAPTTVRCCTCGRKPKYVSSQRCPRALACRSAREFMPARREPAAGTCLALPARTRRRARSPCPWRRRMTLAARLHHFNDLAERAAQTVGGTTAARHPGLRRLAVPEVGLAQDCRLGDDAVPLRGGIQGAAGVAHAGRRRRHVRRTGLPGAADPRLADALTPPLDCLRSTSSRWSPTRTFCSARGSRPRSDSITCGDSCCWSCWSSDPDGCRSTRG